MLSSLFKRIGMVLVLAASASCGSDVNEAKVGPRFSRLGAGETVVYIDMERPERLAKRLPDDPDPAIGAEDRASCEKAGGEWDDVYLYGMLFVREPQEDAVHGGQMCWSTRQPKVFPDGGKPCGGQADCIGNCTAEYKGDGWWFGPVCQKDEPFDCRPIYEAGRYHWLPCEVE
jgi:hypothetical protein